MIMKRTLLICAVALVLFAPIIAADESSNATAERTQQLPFLKTNDFVRVTLYSGDSFTGRVNLQTRDSLMLRRRKSNPLAAVDDIARVEVRRSSVGVLAPVGAIFGAVMGGAIAQSIQSSFSGFNNSSSNGGAVITGAFVGAFMGAGIGALIGSAAHRWEVKYDAPVGHEERAEAEQLRLSIAPVNNNTFGVKATIRW
jgi:hypothetical protein